MDALLPASPTAAQLRLAVIRDEISGRLWSVNQGMSSFLFNQLMDQMAQLQFNCEARVAGGFDAEDRRIGQTDRRLPR